MRFDRSIVDAVGELAQPVGAGADRVAQHARIDRAARRRVFRCPLAQPLRGHRPYSPQRIDRQLVKELLDALPARSR
jgi:hypothetical protein